MNRLHRASFSVAFVLVVGLLTVMCGGVKHVLTGVDYGAYNAVIAVSQLEESLSAAGKLTPTEALAVERANLAAAKDGQALNLILKDWKGGPTPAVIGQLILDLANLETVVQQQVRQSEAQKQLMAQILVAQTAIGKTLVTLGGGGVQ